MLKNLLLKYSTLDVMQKERCLVS